MMPSDCTDTRFTFSHFLCLVLVLYFICSSFEFGHPASFSFPKNNSSEPVFTTSGADRTDHNHPHTSSRIFQQRGTNASSFFVRQSLLPKSVLEWVQNWYTPAGAVYVFLILIAVSILTVFLLRRQYQTNRLLKKRAEELEEAHRKAEQANQAKDDFLARMSHDIRTPLNAIMGMTELLNKTALDREQKEYVQISQQASNTLLILINDILDLSKIESGNITLEQNRIDLEPLIMDIVSYFARKAHEQGLEMPVYIDPDCPTVIGDQKRIQQILVNMINNAIKFTESGEVLVRVTNKSSAKDTVNIRFEVEDTGIGIPNEKQEHIFDRFSQANFDISQEYGGTGLGLAICKHLTKLMNGKIGVNSTEGAGSTFWFEVPFERSDQDTEVQKPSDEQLTSTTENTDLSGLHILLVDDLESYRSILSNLLEEAGASVSTASDGYEALEKVNRIHQAEDSFDLFLIDHQMKDMNGFELADELQNSISLNRTGIMLTSSNLSTDRDRAQRLGFGDYLVKPISNSELLESMTRLYKEDTKFKAINEEQSQLPEWEHMDTPPRILIAEDNEHNRKLMKAILQQYPVCIDFAQNGEKALKMAKSGLFDLIFMDVRMPQMDGLDATRKLRSWEQENNVTPTPVIALTAQALEENRKESLEAGCNEHIAKPVRENQLVHTIRKYMVKDNESPDEDSDQTDPDHEPQDTVSEKGDKTEEQKEPVKVEVDKRFEEFVPDFLDDIQQKCELIREMIDRGNNEKISNLAHDMKGAAGSFGFEKLQELAGQIEEAHQNNQQEQVSNLLHQFERRLDRLTITYV